MSQADNMFKKLGYIIDEDNEVFISFEQSDKYIMFHKNHKSLRIMPRERAFAFLYPEELQAINEKAKEFGWNE